MGRVGGGGWVVGWGGGGRWPVLDARLDRLVVQVMFVLVNVWTISIHDGLYMSRDGIINGAAHHTDHHLFFNYNYGQYLTLWDRVGGTYRKPIGHLHNTKTAVAAVKAMDGRRKRE